ncbi:MAG: hypothetical protein CL477_19120 [Acidobacteria bacterium]|jgi:hypothetical protein|nr:hypothetical protein [Acidobacteriota bacterium]MDP7339036.1 hypothetical protein [Vicinamibacterales bacterium]MDP7480424.1 hypothetical protein [Vicinamibacterales bacterium]HJN46753.1 hypothetical protein [Vicinamibacterales bacterium]|tara:strand:- start:2930 stop:3610 length:681 start_codon:yes stop_codon:yes gene_type:complete
MPESKDLERLVRARMTKTGESYTAARAQLLDKHSRETVPSTPKARYAQVAGMSDAAVQNKTGRTWVQWVGVLDAGEAHAMSHRDIARYVHEQHQVSLWWAQTVTIGYERIRGLREKGQRRGGGYDVNKSRTVPVPLHRLYQAFSTARVRRRWLPDPELTVRTSTRDKSIRFRTTGGDGVEVYFQAKGEQKSQVQVQHRQLATPADAETVRAYWTEALARLTVLLSP